jgi:hypothetical protein
LFFKIGNKRLKVQHKQIRPGERDHDHFKGPPLFPDANCDGDILDDFSTGNHSGIQDPDYKTSPENGAADPESGTGQNEGFEVMLDQKPADGKNALNLDSIREALPGASNEA